MTTYVPRAPTLSGEQTLNLSTISIGTTAQAGTALSMAGELLIVDASYTEGASVVLSDGGAARNPALPFISMSTSNVTSGLSPWALNFAAPALPNASTVTLLKSKIGVNGNPNDGLANDPFNGVLSTFHYDSNYSPNNYFNISTSTGPGLCIQTYGAGTQDRVGINTTAPAYNLDVSGNARITGNFLVSGTTETINSVTIISQQTTITNAGTGPALVCNQTGVQPICDFQANGVTVFHITDGNVGIQKGTTAPSYTVDVSGNVGASAGFYGSGANLTSLNASSISSGTLGASYLQASGVVANTYGDATHIPALTVDTAGRVTAASTYAVVVPTETSQLINNSGFITSVPTTISAATTFSASGAAVNISSGYLKAPNQFAFCYSGNSTPPAAGAKITYPTAIFQIGSGYNGTDTFTAPTNGVYLFTFAVFCNNDFAFLKKNGSLIIGFVNQGSGNPHPETACSVVASLVTGDTVAVYADGGGANNNADNLCCFSGALLFAI